MVCLALIYVCFLVSGIPAFAAARQEKAHFSDLLEATGVYHEGDKAPRPTTYRPPFKLDSVAADELEVGLITKELNKKTATAQSDKTGRKKEFNGKDADVAPSDEPTAPAGDTRIHIGHRDDSSGFMPRSLRTGNSFGSVPHPLPSSLGFPSIESFFNNFENTVDWGTVRIRRDTGSETELLETDGDTESAIIEKRDANPEPSRLDHISVLPPPHDLPPRPDLPLFPPLGSPPPHHHSPTPVPASGHHVTISTPTHHVSHGVADHGTHHAVHKEHHQVHGNPGHHNHMVHHELASPRSHALTPGHLPPQPNSIAPVHVPVAHPSPHVPVAVAHPSPHVPVAVAHPSPHVPVHHPISHPVPTKVYDHPKSGYPKPAYGGSLEDIFGVKHGYHTPKPAYHAPEPAYHAPEPAYHPPEPAYEPPKPAYHEPKPEYHAPVSPYVPDYSHPTGDYVPPLAKMAGHPFSLEAVFGIGMPKYYMKKYPHMAHMMHHGHHDHHDHHPHPADTYVEPPKPAYKPVKVYDHPTSGYAKPAHGATLEEIFGIATAYHSPTKPAYHPPKPEYHPPKPVYDPPKPEYHLPKPEYHPPKPEYHPPKPEYHPPKPEYHPPKPEYHPPKPHKPGYGIPQPHGGTLEAVFGLTPTSYITPAPHYEVPTTYKPKMPDYIAKHPHSKGLPPLHSDPGYVLHYLPYDNYKPVHEESIAHPPPVPHHPEAAHMLVPGTHVLPEPSLIPNPELIPHPAVPNQHSLLPHQSLLPQPDLLPQGPPHPNALPQQNLLPHPSLLPQPDLLPHSPHNAHPHVKSLDPFRGARKKRSPPSERLSEPLSKMPTEH